MCRRATGTSNDGTFVYVGNAESQSVTIFSLDRGRRADLGRHQSGAGPGQARQHHADGGQPGQTVSLTSALRNEPYSAATFAIDAKTGKLAYVGSGPLADAMAYIATDRSGKFLLCASYGGGKIAVNPIGGNGVVSPAQQVIASQPNAHAVLADRANRHVLYTSLGNDYVGQLVFDAATGKLTPNDSPTMSVKAKAGPRHFRFSPDERFVYLLCELDASIYVFPYDAATGRLAKETQIASALPPGLLPASPGRPTFISRRTANSSTPPSARRARLPLSASTPRAARLALSAFIRPRRSRAASPSTPPAARCSRSGNCRTA